MSMRYDNSQYFYYKGKTYSSGTVIKISQAYCNAYSYRDKPIWPYAKFDRKFVKDSLEYYVFSICNIDMAGQWRKYTGSFIINTIELDAVIEQIIKPLEIKNVELVIPEQKMDWEDNNVLLLWAIYIAVMVGSLIFKQFYIIWVVATCVFIKYRKEMLNR